MQTRRNEESRSITLIPVGPRMRQTVCKSVTKKNAHGYYRRPDQSAERSGKSREEVLEGVGKGRPLGRLAEPEAIAAWEKCIAVDPDLAEAHNLLGAALASAGDLERAEKELLRALQIHPDLADAQGNLGHLLAIRGDLAQAPLQPGEMTVLVHHPPPVEMHDLVDAVTELVAAVLDVHLGQPLVQVAAIHIGNARHAPPKTHS